MEDFVVSTMKLPCLREGNDKCLPSLLLLYHVVWIVTRDISGENKHPIDFRKIIF